MDFKFEINGAYFPDLSKFPYFCMDFETTGLQFWKDSIFGIALSTPDGYSYYWDVREVPGAMRWLKAELKNGKLWVNHNIKYDVLFAIATGVVVPVDDLGCTMIRAALIDEHRLTYDLDSVAKDCIGVGKDTGVYAELASLFGGKVTADAQMPNLHRAPSTMAGKYAVQDTNTALRLWEWQEKEIDMQGLNRVDVLERQLIPVMVDIEYRGVRVDIPATKKAIHEIDQRSKVLQKELDGVAGFSINPNPSGSIHKLFNPQFRDGSWILNDGTIAGTTEAGKASINADVLRDMKHPAASMILRLRKMLKTRDTFLKGHILGHHHNGVVHANYNQAKSENDRGTGSGRLSVNSPALQQIPARDKDIASVARALFLPDEGQEWCCWDWAQMDFRMMAHYVNNPVINKAYAEDPDTDFHALAASLTGLPRSPRFAGDANAKQINLGLVFGMGTGKLAWEMGLPYTTEVGRNGKVYFRPGPEAMEVFKNYHEAIPGVQLMLERAGALAKDRGFVKTVMGRKIRFPGGFATHKAGGLIFQGSAADALKQKLIEVHHEVKGTESRLLASVHDEYDLSVPIGDTALHNRISEILTTFDGVKCPIHFRVPIRTELGRGPNWWEASK